MSLFPSLTFLTHCHLQGAHQSTFLDTGGFRPTGWKGEILHRWPLKNIDLFSNHSENSNKTIHFRKEEEESFSILQFILQYFTSVMIEFMRWKKILKKIFFGKFSIHGKNRDVNVSYFFRISYFFNACAHSPFFKFKMWLKKSFLRFINLVIDL